MTNRRALTIPDGVIKNVIDADSLIVGAGVTTAAGNISIGSTGGLTILTESTQLNSKLQQKVGTIGNVADLVTLSGGNYFVETGGGVTVRDMSTIGWQEGSVVTIAFDAGANWSFLASTAPANSAPFSLIPVRSVPGYFTAAGDVLTFTLCTINGGQVWLQTGQVGSLVGTNAGFSGGVTAGGFDATGLVSAGSLQVTGTTFLQGQVTMSSADVSVLNAAQLLIADSHPYLNYGYVTVAAQTNGLVVNYLPTSTVATATGSFVAGVAAVSNPTVLTTVGSVFAAGDIVQIFLSGTAVNVGLFEVLSHTSGPNTLTIRGVGLTACVEDFTQDQFVAGFAATYSIRKVNVSVIRAGTDGIWETGKGAVTPITFTDIGGASSPTVDVPGTSGEALAIGAPVVWDDAAGVPRVFRSDANGGGELANVVGINVNTAAGASVAVSVRVAGEIAIPDAIWDVVPAVGDVGKRAYMSENVGKLTLTAPAISGSRVQRVGLVSFGGAGAVRLIVQVGEGTTV